MPNELTRLLKVASRGPRTTCAALFAPDLACAALCAIFKLLSYCLKYFILFYLPGKASFVFLLVLGEILNCWVPACWLEIILSFEAAAFKGAHTAAIDSEQSSETKNAAFKANRKGKSIPNVIRASAELVVDQSITTFAAFSKAGCSWLFACGASAAMLCLPLLLQLRSMRLAGEVAAYQRQKETEVATEHVFQVYANHARALVISDSCRRTCVLSAFGLLVFVANTEEPQDFVLVVPLILHTDGKLAKLWKALADAESAWVFLQMQHLPPVHDLHQQIIHSSIHHPQPASEVSETVPRKDAAGTKKVDQALGAWKDGAEYKTEQTGTIIEGLHWRKSPRKNLGDDTDED